MGRCAESPCEVHVNAKELGALDYLQQGAPEKKNLNFVRIGMMVVALKHTGMPVLREILKMYMGISANRSVNRLSPGMLFGPAAFCGQ